MVHPLLMGQARPAGAGGTVRSSGRGSRGSRGSAGPGGSASARQQQDAALGLLRNERIIWDGNGGNGIPEQALMDAIEVLWDRVCLCLCVWGGGVRLVGGWID